jgi:hypothetical protein
LVVIEDVIITENENLCSTRVAALIDALIAARWTGNGTNFGNKDSCYIGIDNATTMVK